MKKIIIHLFLPAMIATSLSASAESVETTKLFGNILNKIEQEGRLNNASDDSIELAQFLMTQILSNEALFNRIKQEDGSLMLDEETAHYVFSSMKEHLKALGSVTKEMVNEGISKASLKYLDAKGYGKEKYEKFQQKLDEKIPVFRQNIAQALSVINGFLGKADVELISLVMKIATSLATAGAAVAGAAFGVPFIPSLVVGLTGTILSQPATIAGAIAGVQTLLTIAAEIIAVAQKPEPQPEQNAEEKGQTLVKIANAVLHVYETFKDHYYELRPEQTSKLKEGLVAIGDIIGLFL